jgi:hypothetical protein
VAGDASANTTGVVVMVSASLIRIDEVVSGIVMTDDGKGHRLARVGRENSWSFRADVGQWCCEMGDLTRTG